MLKGEFQAYTESVIFTVGFVALSFYLKPGDPLLVHAHFPWIWFVPALIALRHGRISAAISAGIIILAMLHTMHIGMFTWNTYQLWLLGGLTLTLICSEFYAYWIRRQSNLSQKSHYLDNRLESLSRAYGVLRLSHDRLEESLIIKPATLRQSFMDLRKLLMKDQGKFTPEIANAYIELLDSQTGLNTAGLYLHQQHKWEKSPIAFVGKSLPLELNDILVKRCLTKRQSTYVAINLLEENEVSNYLAVIPMITAEGHIMGLLTISEMPFLVLNEETLKKLTVLLAYIADEVWASNKAPVLQTKYPDCPSMFASEIFKLERLWKIAGVDSSVAAFYIKPGPQHDDLVFFFQQEKRALDIIWQINRDDVTTIIVLMPLTGRSMLTGYIQRMEISLSRQFNLVLGENPIFFQHRQLSAYENIDSLLSDLINNDNHI